ncbi:MAG: HD-GYP domain-containing protein [Lachnospiraceae bacterium]|jgi:putative nucleotidyltransferase with HDIG domain|nr:HD-GYP domain-containing protein [Lachnospiraceae bacterium]MDE6920395.1 HD-GYP domain-containing protein [Lachnospiraceae bacterium]MDE6942770.1 HD-GYP domain-containing protein [Lachnospiraceae bacterium]MDE6989709.1 HD-GYP domain-containing protein [Lachnospiraceae bacterium]
MRQIPIAALTPGMITAAEIVSYDHVTIVPKGIILTENIISRLEGYSIYYAYIEDDFIVDLSTPMTGSAVLTQDASTAAEAPAGNTQFHRFYQGFVRCAEHFEANLMKSLHRNEPFRANELLKETMALLHQDRQEISVFDMLLNMHNTEDSVCNHCIDVALICNILSRWLHFSETDQMMATACGLFHDVGKFMLPAGILRKPGKLTPDEFEIIKTHTTEGFHLLGRYSSIPEPVKNAALMHHEKCDGSGYPYGLKGDDIDRFSKIVTIADIFDAMTSERVYRAAMCPFSVIKYFEDDGIQKYEIKFILTFLENVSNAYLNHKVTLSNGMEGNVIFINPDNYSRPVVRTENNEIIDLQKSYYQSMLQLSNQKNISIETII